MQQRSTYMDDDIDLREVVRILLKNWIILVAFTVLGAVIALGLSIRQRPVYQATAQIVAGTVYSPVYGVSVVPTDLSSLLLSSQIRQAVAQKLGVAVETLPGAGVAHSGINIVAIGKTNPQPYSITVQSSSAQQAARIANAWADAALVYIDQSSQLAAQQEKARTAIQEADKALVEYLAQSQLSQLTWADLQALTGIGSVANSLEPSNQAQANVNIIQPGAQQLPNITSPQRLQLAALMQARLDAQTEYDYFHAEAIQTAYAGAANARVIQSYANVPRAPAQPRTSLNLVFGAAVGLALAALSVYLRAWWQSDNPQSRQ